MPGFPTRIADSGVRRAQMTLRPLLEIAEGNERLRALREALHSSGDGTVDAYVSGSMRPYLLATLIAGDDEAPRVRCWWSRRTIAPLATWRVI